jgi:hypothetical protein
MSIEEFNSSDLDNFLLELTDSKLPLASHKATDPFHKAQILQQGIDSAAQALIIGEDEPRSLQNDEVKKLFSQRALAELNNKFLPELRKMRIALLTAHVFAIYSKSHAPQEPYFSEVAVVSGVLEKFYYTPVPDEDSDKTLVAHLVNPRFLDPDFIDASSYHGIVVPVMDIHDWSPHFNVN